MEDIPPQTDDQATYMGGTPPVHITATNCHTITMNVQIVVEARQHDTIRRWAEDIARCQKLTNEAKNGI